MHAFKVIMIMAFMLIELVCIYKGIDAGLLNGDYVKGTFYISLAVAVGVLLNHGLTSDNLKEIKEKLEK